MKKTTKSHAFELARELARESHEENFSSRRGTGEFEDKPLIYLYDNNPYLNAPGRREAEHYELRESLAKKGIVVVGTARYPTWSEGEDDMAEYTIGTIFTAPDELAIDVLDDEWGRILRASHEAAMIFRSPRRR